MSVEASEWSSEVWTRWQGQVINGVFPLGRYLGCSNHSGVFLTRSAARHPAEVAIKLVPTNRAQAESQLPRWKRAGGLTHPHLLRLLEWGGCQLDGMPYLYVVMEYADQTLAQLLQHRALTEDEAREMLVPMLDALAFLHGRHLLQGQLKPANVLVVGDQLKLASDTIRRLSERPVSTAEPGLYDPPEARQGSSSTADDVWALGVTLFEALTRRAPSGLGTPGEGMPPANLSPTSRDILALCLSPSPQDRPRASELLARVQGRPAVPAPVLAVEPAPPPVTAPTPVAHEPPPRAELVQVASEPPPRIESVQVASEPPPRIESVQVASEPPPRIESVQVASEPPPRAELVQVASEPPPRIESAQVTSEPPPRAESVQVVPEPAPPSVSQPPKPRTLQALLFLAVMILVLAIVARAFTLHHSPAAPPSAVPASAESPPETSRTGEPTAAAPPPAAVAKASAGTAATSGSAVREVIPEVPRSARRGIRGHIKVWVRVILNPDGSVFAAIADRAGPSRYFRRLALEAAKNWTFPPAQTPSRRLMQVRFDFTRDGTTGRAVTLP